MCRGGESCQSVPEKTHTALCRLENCVSLTLPELQSALHNPSTGQPKRIECVRVDGAAHEGPSHDEVKFY